MNKTAHPVGGLASGAAWWIVLLAVALQALLGVAYGVPGHLSVDSVVQLYEGRTHQFISWHPPMMSMLLGLLDRVVPGTALFVLLDQGLLSGALLLLWRASPRRTALPGALLAAVVALNPLLIAYTGIVWKDVFFAHLALFGYACLLKAAGGTAAASRLAWSAACLLALALAGSLRQQGLLLALPAVAYAAYMFGRGWLVRLSLAAAGVAVMLGINVGIVALADRIAVGNAPPRAEIGLRGLLLYDLVGIVARGGALADVDATTDARALVPTFDIYRIDGLARPAPNTTLAQRLDAGPVSYWWRSVATSPAAYTQHRLRHFATLLGFADTRRCLPLHVGVIEQIVHPAVQRDLVAELRLVTGVDARAQRLYDWFSPHFDGPLFRHWVWAIALAVATILHFWRGSAALGWLGVGALAFATSYVVISLACDFRYVYVLPVAATGLWFALFAGVWRRY